MPPGACLSLRWGREDGKTALSGPYDRPRVRCGRPAALRIPRIPRIRDKWPGSEPNQPPEPRKSRRRGRPNPFALPLPLRKTGPRLSPQHTCEGPGTRRRPTSTPKLQPRNPTPQRRYGPPLLQGDRHAPESVIGLSELVTGIVGIRSLGIATEEVAPSGPIAFVHVVEPDEKSPEIGVVAEVGNGVDVRRMACVSAAEIF